METPVANELLACLRAHGQRLDFEIAQETGVTVRDVREHFAVLLASGEVVACKLTRFNTGKPVVAMMYRASGYFPPAAPGRKPKSAAGTSIAGAPVTPGRLADG